MMPRCIFQVLRTCLIPVLLLLLLTACGSANSHTRFSAQRVGLFDTWITFVGYAENEESFAPIAEIVFDKLGELHRHFDI